MNREDLEALVDKVGPAAAVDMLADVFHRKAEHVQHAWQDDTLGAAWSRAARSLDAAIVVARGIPGW